jgi:hypothetical protein
MRDDADDIEPNFASCALLQPGACGCDACVTGNDEGAVWPGHLREQRRHEPRIAEIIGAREPRFTGTGMGVRGQHRQTGIACRADQTVERNRINTQLINPPHRVSVVGHRDEMLREQYVAALRALGENDARAFDIPPCAQFLDERGPLRFKNTQLHGALNRNAESAPRHSAGNREAH